MNILEDRDIVITHVIMACLSKALPDRDNDVYTHTRRYHGLILRLRGSTIYEIGGRPRVSCPGDIILITKGTRYTLSDRTGGECLVVNFETLDEYDQNVIFLHPKNTAFYDGFFRREIRLGRADYGSVTPRRKPDLMIRATLSRSSDVRLAYSRENISESRYENERYGRAVRARIFCLTFSARYGIIII